jgi:hypothetical protein
MAALFFFFWHLLLFSWWWRTLFKGTIDDFVAVVEDEAQIQRDLIETVEPVLNRASNYTYLKVLFFSFNFFFLCAQKSLTLLPFCS